MTTGDRRPAKLAGAAVATPHHAATRAAGAVLREGGNAVDAAVTAAAVLSVAYPHNVSIGGDLVALLRTPDGRTICVNGSGAAPAGLTREHVGTRSTAGMPRYGVDSVTVPGAVAGWQSLHELAGRLPWSRCFDEAIAFARAGVEVAPDLAACLQSETHLYDDPGAAAVFASHGTPLRVGERLVQPQLAATLEQIRDEGAAALYAGQIGEALVAGLRELGAVISTADLAAHTTEITPALHAGFAGLDVATSPPNTQGFLLLRALRGVEAAGILDALLTSSASGFAALLAEGNRVRDALLADPRHATVDIAALLGDDPPPSDGSPGPGTRPNGDTVGVAVVDSDGVAVSLIQSVYYAFGAGVLEPSTGILLHNRACSFSLDPRSPNRLEPGKRPAHTLMPAIVTEGGALRWVLATQGGQGQPQVHLQLLARLIAGETPESAVGAPRMIVGGVPAPAPADAVVVEATLDPVALAALRASSHPVVEVPAPSDLVGQANIVAVDAAGGLAAASDPRADGLAIVIPCSELLPRRSNPDNPQEKQ